MDRFLVWCITASGIMAYVNLVYLVILSNKLNEIESEISRLKNRKGGDGK